MSEEKRDVLEVLKIESMLVKLGVYSQRSSLGPEFIFEDSPTCINCDRENPLPCTECPLIQFVPPEHRSEKIACRHIPLNTKGETLDFLYRYGNAREIREAVDNWLVTTIERLESERRQRVEGRTVSSIDLRESF